MKNFLSFLKFIFCHYFLPIVYMNLVFVEVALLLIALHPYKKKTFCLKKINYFVY